MMDEKRQRRIEAREAVLAELKGILIRNLHVPASPEEIDPDTPLFGTGLRLDSIDAVELWISVSETYGFRVPDDERRITALRTLNTLAELILQECDARARRDDPDAKEPVAGPPTTRPPGGASS